MTEVRFYHLQRKTVEQVLPQLLEKVLALGMRIVVVAGSNEQVERFNQLLWTWNPASFLPHGSPRDGFASDQPIWLTTTTENPNKAQVLVLTDGFTASDKALSDFLMVCDLFNGNDPQALAAARNRWRACKSVGHQLAYWQQTEAGSWVRKA